MARSVLKFLAYVVATILAFGVMYTVFVWRPWITRIPRIIPVSFVLVQDSGDVFTLTQLKINGHDVNTDQMSIIFPDSLFSKNSYRTLFSR